MKMEAMPQVAELTLPRLMADLKRTGQRLEDAPPALVREAQKRGFPDMRSILLPPPTIRAALSQPLLRELLVTRSGYCSRSAGHYIPRPEGSLDHIMVYCVAGQGWVRVGDREWTVPADTALFLPPHVPHTYGADAEKPWSIYWLHFTGPLADDYFTELGVNVTQPLLHLPCTEEVLTAYEAIYAHMSAVHTRPHLVAASAALANFLSLIQLRRLSMEGRTRTEEENVQQTITYMQNNLSRPIMLRELSNLAHMSISRYETAFRRRTGCTPITYFNRLRVQLASRLLMETQQTVREVAEHIGISNPYYFSRLFKKHTGVAPAYFNKSRSPTKAKYPPARGHH